ncbi:MAG: hypothetical protein OXB86_04890 [Bdellovibrionales bacterium]|nr:hypothetical protein [Bdellovibrionales bacterium]
MNKRFFSQKNSPCFWLWLLKNLKQIKTTLLMACCLALLFPVTRAFAYPWLDFKDKQDSPYFSIGMQSSYFVAQKSWLHLVPSMDVKYSNLMVDVDLGGQYSYPEKSFYFRLSELALTFPIPFSSKWNFSLGFKKNEWIKADLYWSLGLWQPRYLVDPFRPVPIGRPGFYLNYKGYSSFTLYLSYLSFPDLSIIPKLDNGAINSKNAFFISPVTLKGDSKETAHPFKWDIKEMPSLKWGTLLKPALSLHTSHKLPHFQLSLAYAYKPSHRFRYFVFGHKCTLSQLSNESCPISDVDYSISYHHLLSAEVEMSPLKDMTVFGTLIYENPRALARNHTSSDIGKAFFRERKTELPSLSSPVTLNGQKGHWFSLVPTDHLTASIFLYYREGAKTKEQTTITAGYLRPLWQEKNPNNSFIRKFAPLLGESFLWKHTLSFSLEHWIKDVLHGYQFQFRLNHSLDNKIYQASFENKLNLFPSLQVSLSGDVLFPAEDQGLKSDTSAIQLYKNHSRVLFGVKYVF